MKGQRVVDEKMYMVGEGCMWVLLELPGLAAHGAVSLGALLLNPFQDAVQMEDVVAFAPDWR
jgi:hypothetical protein